jgi:hypothetical protein
MKKFLMAIVLCLVCTFSFGQLNIKTQQEVAKYETVFKWWNGGWGQIRYFFDTEQFVLFGVSDNNFEERMHSIILGEDKVSAIKSLQQISELRQTKFEDVLIVNGFNNKQTKLYKVLGCLYFETQGVAGVSYALTYLNINKVDQAILAIENFNI